MPVLRDPRGPTSVGPGLTDGASLRIEGTPGDGENDRLKIGVTVSGVIDPRDTDVPLPEPGSGQSVYRAQVQDPADRYELAFFVDGVELRPDSLGAAHRREPSTTIGRATRIDDTTYEYVLTADLPFDVDPEGTEATLKVELTLPEGGVSDYEATVSLVPFEVGAVVVVGGRTYEFELVEFFGVTCQLRDDDSLLIAAGYVDGDFDKAEFNANLEPAGNDTENLFSAHYIVVNDPETGESWMADHIEHPSMQWMEMIPAGGSQIDFVSIDGGYARGTATFIDSRAAQAAWSNSTAFPSPVPGRFEIRCAEGG